jgi:carbonic anhydrase/acetyltransferase-like protein (isoleucine patch superfamily)
MILTLAGRTPRIAASAYIAPSADIIGSVDVGATERNVAHGVRSGEKNIQSHAKTPRRKDRKKE